MNFSPRRPTKASGLSLVEVLIGAAVSALAALLIARALKLNSAASKATADRQASQIELRQITARLQRDFLRRKAAGSSLQNSPQVFGTDSLCQNLVINQTILPSSVRTIEYRTECSGPPFSDGNSRSSFYRELSVQCAGLPVIRIRTTEPGGSTKTETFPTQANGQGAVVCARLGPSGNPGSVQTEILLGRTDKQNHWQLNRDFVHLGMDGAGDGVEVIPPQ